MHLHILGICGTLMGSIALLAKQQGHKVTGTDQNVYPPMSDQLAEAGISLSSPYTSSCIPDGVELVIIGNANLPRGNPAVEQMLDNNIPYTSGAEYLGRYLLNEKWVIAIAGTHGKTTTASMVTWILEYAGLNPGYLIGGIPTNFDQSARLGGTFFVIEADEYDTSYFDRRSKFLHYRPRTLVLNNLEFDHADIFPDLEAIKQQFHLLLRTVPSTGLIIHPATDTHLNDVLSRGCWSETLALGESSMLDAKALNDSGSHFEVLLKTDVIGDVNWALTGQHNISNALAAIAAARHIGVTPAISCQALSEFSGVKRRMEIIYQDSKLTVYDDFAHHPTAIKTTLDGLRKANPADQILAIIEPGSHTMRQGTHAQTLKDSTAEAHKTLWYQPSNINWDMREHLEDQNNVICSDINKLLDSTLALASQYQQIIVMSNSGFGGFHKQLIALLEKRAREEKA